MCNSDDEFFLDEELDKIYDEEIAADESVWRSLWGNDSIDDDSDDFGDDFELGF